jgi:hypothetical protein
VSDQSGWMHLKPKAVAVAVAEVVAHHKSRHPLLDQEILQVLGLHLGPWAQTPDTDVCHLVQYVENRPAGEQCDFDLTLCRLVVRIAAILQVFDARLRERP